MTCPTSTLLSSSPSPATSLCREGAPAGRRRSALRAKLAALATLAALAAGCSGKGQLAINSGGKAAQGDAPSDGDGGGKMSLGKGGFKAKGVGKVALPKGLANPGSLEVRSAPDDRASKALAPVERLEMLGYRVSSDFHKTGEVEIALLPLDAKGDAILDQNLYVELSAKLNLPVPLEGDVSVGELRPAARAQRYQMVIDVDSSGSMSLSDKGRRRVRAASGFIDTVAKGFPNSEFAVFEFETDVHKLVDFTADASAAKRAVSSVKEAGSTALHDSALQALDYLDKGRKPGLQPGLLVLSDGADSASKRGNAAAVIAKAKALNVPINVVALGGALDVPGLSFVGDLQRYAAETRGVFVYAKHADQLDRAFENMALASSKGQLVVRAHVKGAAVVPFTTMSMTMHVHAGGKDQAQSFDFIVPMK